MRRFLLLIMLLFIGNTLFAQRYHLLLNHIVGQDSLPENVLVSIFQDRIVALELNYNQPLPRGTIDLRSFWAVPMFIGLELDTAERFPDDISYLDLNWYDSPEKEIKAASELLFSVKQPIIQRPLLLELPYLEHSGSRLPAILYYSEPEQVSDWLEAARQWGFSLASPREYPPQAILFRHSMRHQAILDILNESRPGRIYIREPALIADCDIQAFQRIIPDKALSQISDSLANHLDYVLFSDLNSYFACLDTINRLPDKLLPLIADPDQWYESAQRIQSTHFFSMLWENPAKYLGIQHEYGGIELGKKANIFFMDKNPIDIGAKIVLIMKDGKFREFTND